MQISQAYWISPTGSIFPLPDRTLHADMVFDIPDQFGLTEESIRELEDRTRHNGVVHYLAFQGWVRVRKSGTLWNIQVSADPTLQEKALKIQIPHWAGRYDIFGEFCVVKDCDGRSVVEKVRISNL